MNYLYLYINIIIIIIIMIFCKIFLFNSLPKNQFKDELLRKTQKD